MYSIALCARTTSLYRGALTRQVFIVASLFFSLSLFAVTVAFASSTSIMAVETSSDGAQFFLGLPNEILIHEICNYLPAYDICVLFGQTCQAIRREHYRITTVYTPDRPLSVWIYSETEEFSPDGPFNKYLLRQARIWADVIPVDVGLLCGKGRTRYGKRRMSEFKYTICRIRAYCDSPRYLILFLERHPEFASLSTIHLEPQCAITMFETAFSETIPSIVFPGVQTVLIDSYPIFFSPILACFPRATPLVSWFRTPEHGTEELYLPHICKILETAQIHIMDVTCAGFDGLLEQYRSCIRRTVDLFVVADDISSATADILVSEFSSRAACDVRHGLSGHGAPTCPVYAKYVTELILPWLGLAGRAEYYVKIIHGFTSVRRLELEIIREVSAARLSVKTPDDTCVVEAKRGGCIIVESPAPLWPPDMEYMIVAIDGMSQIRPTDPTTVDEWDEFAWDVARHVSEIRQRIPQTRDPAWRVLYKFETKELDVSPITGYV